MLRSFAPLFPVTGSVSPTTVSNIMTTNTYKYAAPLNILARTAQACLPLKQRINVTIGLLLCVLFISTANAEFQARGVNAIEAAEILKQNPDIKILDVRTGFEFRRGHLEDAINLNYYSFSFKSNLGKLDKNTTWLVHCHSGVRSSKTIPLMEAAGFTNVIDVTDGMVGWKKAGLPVVK